MTTYYPTIGLEIHAELNTRSKMFCGCLNDPFLSDPNTNICPVCMAHPGALPVPNVEAMKKVVIVGLAVGGKVANFSEFDRKNYFYPDIPKGYQISQYKHPIVSGGELAGVAITRVHLEEDTATSQHGLSGGTLIDFNRAGVPLMELVTEPVIRDAETAMEFAKELQLLLRYLGVSDANMEQGQMRVEVNVSISPDPEVFGTKVEIKNLNSFSVAGKAITYEIERMTKLYEAGRESEIVQETRGWDDKTNSTKSQRTKENSADYRYFPEPDIPKFYLHDLFDLENLRAGMSETPAEKRNRYRDMYGLKSEDIEFFVTFPVYAIFFENVATDFGESNKSALQITSNYICSDLVGLATELGQDVLFSHITPVQFSELIRMNMDSELNSRGTKDILRMMVTGGGLPRDLAKEHGLLQQNDSGALLEIVQAVIFEFPDIVAEFRKGKDSVIMFLVGQCMKRSRGAGNPTVLQELLRKELVG